MLLIRLTMGPGHSESYNQANFVGKVETNEKNN